jgi:hypothetical protein
MPLLAKIKTWVYSDRGILSNVLQQLIWQPLHFSKGLRQGNDDETMFHRLCVGRPIKEYQSPGNQ